MGLGGLPGMRIALVRALLPSGCAMGALLVSAAPVQAQTTPPQGTVPTARELAPRVAETPPELQVTIRRNGEQEECPAALRNSPVMVDISDIDFKRPNPENPSELIDLQPEIRATLAGVQRSRGRQPVSVVCTVRDEANDALRAAGWIAKAQIPPQEIVDGKLRLLVVAGRISEVHVRGNPGPYAALINDRIAALKRIDPLNERTAEALLLKAGDLPGLDVSLILIPATGRQGEVIGEMEVSFHRYTILANFQNYNSRLIGRETGYLRAEAYGLTGMADITYLGFSATAQPREQKILQAGHGFGVDSEGTRIGGRFTYAWSRPDLGTLDYRTDTLAAGLDIERPVLRSVAANVGLNGGFEYVNQITKIFSGKTGLPLNSDRMRILFGGVSADARSNDRGGAARWSVTAHLEMRKGLSIFDASDAGFAGPRFQSRIEGNSRAFVVRGEARAYLRLGGFLGVEQRMLAQWTDDPLLNYEEFSVGNMTIGRGYDPGSNSGDRAVSLSSEVQLRLPVPAKRLTFQLFGFMDFVRLTNLDTASTETDRLLRSYGGGVRLGLPGNMLFEATYAHPRDRALRLDAAPPPNRLLLSLSVRFQDPTR